MKEDLEVVIDADGDLQFIYSDDLLALFALGQTTVQRVSSVEPCALGWIGGGWTADLSPVGGPLLGPFDTREAALAEEVAWLKSMMATRRLEVKQS